MTETPPAYEVAVVGGGIAGLAIAEIFARSGVKVVLIERNKQVCREASAAQHGWFHFGSLYSIFPSNQFLRTMVGGVEDLLEYYSGFGGMNIRVTETGGLAFPQAGDSWFRADPIEYIVAARNDPDFDMRTFGSFKSYAHKLVFLATWEFAIKQFISRHQRFHKHNWGGDAPASQIIPRAGWADYSREVISKPDIANVNLDPDTHFRIVGFDRPMNSMNIVRDLLRGFIGSGGVIMNDCEVQSVERTGGQNRLVTSRGALIADKVILASGRSLKRFLRDKSRVKVVASPLLVASPAVTDHNFVRLTPFMEKSVNHLLHGVSDQSYSVIGGSYYADADNAADMAKATADLAAMAESVFPLLRKSPIRASYMGYKTEFVAKIGERNYQYVIRETDPGVFAVLPGKFSLAFSLAINAYKRVTGSEPSKAYKLAPVDAASGLVGMSEHARLVDEALARA